MQSDINDFHTNWNIERFLKGNFIFLITVGVNLQDKILCKVSTSLSLFLRLLDFMRQNLLATYFVLRNEKIDTIMKLINSQSSTSASSIFLYSETDYFSWSKVYHSKYLRETFLNIHKQSKKSQRAYDKAMLAKLVLSHIHYGKIMLTDVCLVQSFDLEKVTNSTMFMQNICVSGLGIKIVNWLREHLAK